MLAQPPWTLPGWESRPDSEREEAKKGWAEAEQGLRQYIDGADEFETALWFKWALRVALILLGIAGWVLFFMRVRFWRVLVFTTGLIFILGQGIFHSVVYSELLQHWIAGYTGFKFFTWSMTLLTLYQYFVLPILLAVVTAVPFWGSSSERRGARAGTV